MERWFTLLCMLIDSHCHLSSDALYAEAAVYVERAFCAGVQQIVNICTDPLTLTRGKQLANTYPNQVFLTAATTPHDVEQEGKMFFPLVEEALQAKELIAIGETGLDYYYAHSAKNIQQDYLLQYVDLAQRYDVPLIFHCREAFVDLFSLTSAYRGRGVIHCFTGTLSEAKQALDRGWMVSISGIVTFPKSTALQEVVRYIPLERLFIETDSPYLSPKSKRGSTNEPAFMVETAEKIAELKQKPLEEVCAILTENISSYLRLEKNS